MFRRVVVFLCASGAALALAGPVAAQRPAHIHPDPSTAQAGSEQVVGFTVEHGCSTSPTVQLEMRLPEGVTNAAPLPIEGWTASITDNVVTFAGGPLPAKQEQAFQISMTLPPTPDTTIYFPFVQRCEVGEIRWISTDGKADEPAPAMKLTGPVATTTAPPTTETIAPSTTAAPTTTASTPTTAAPTSAAPTTSAAPATASPVATTPVTIVDRPSESSSTGTIVFITVVALIAAAAAVIALRARRRRP